MQNKINNATASGYLQKSLMPHTIAVGDTVGVMMRDMHERNADFVLKSYYYTVQENTTILFPSQFFCS